MEGVLLGRFMLFFFKLLLKSLFFFLIIFNICAVLYLYLDNDLPSVKRLANYEPIVPSIVYDTHGEKVGEIYERHCYPVPLEKISKHVINAFIASEDLRFFDHDGIDIKSLFRALYNTVKTQSFTQGGSTITQQVAKNIFLTKEKTFERKLKDVLLAYEIEKNFTKKEILNLYLNTIYLGHNSYGVEAASLRYFNKKSQDISLSQAAFLASLSPAPSLYSKAKKFNLTLARQSNILAKMLEQKMINKKEYTRAKNETLSLSLNLKNNFYGKQKYFFLEEVKKEIHKLGISDAKVSGLKVYTTLDFKKQKEVETTSRKFLEKYDNKKFFLGALKSHGQNFREALYNIINDEPQMSVFGVYHGIIVYKHDKTRTIAVATSSGLGLIIPEHQKKFAKKSYSESYYNMLELGDEIRVIKSKKHPPKYINSYLKDFDTLKKYLDFYKESKSRNLVEYYNFVDYNSIEPSLILSEPQTGAVRAMIGSSSFTISQFNRAKLAKRPIASCIKPLYYAYALDNGFDKESFIHYKPIEIGNWSPRNNGFVREGQMLFSDALVYSHNIASIHLYKKLQSTKLKDYFYDLGFPKISYSNLSVALGAVDMSLFELQEAYSIFANHGKRSRLYFIERIDDRYGQTVFKYKIKKGKAIISSETASQIYDILRDIVKRGTGYKAYSSKFEGAGKTGTSNKNTDAWFLGFIDKRLELGVRLGYDNFSLTLGRFGSGTSLAAPYWKAIAEEVVLD